MPGSSELKQDVLFLNEIGKLDIDIAGGKGANLGELLQQSFPVPPGFVIAADVYGDFVKSLIESTPPLTSYESKRSKKHILLNPI